MTQKEPPEDQPRPTYARLYNETLAVHSGADTDRELLLDSVDLGQLTGWPAVENRLWLIRVVTYLAEHDIRQYLDIGAGLPAWGNVHEVARHIHPGARVAYVDFDPEVVDAWQVIAARDGAMCSARADVRRPWEVTHHPEVCALIDFSRPVGLIMSAVLNQVPQADQLGIIQVLTDALSPGSYLAMSQVCDDDESAAFYEMFDMIMERTGVPLYFSSRREITDLFEGLKVVDPGVVPVARWRPVHYPNRDPGQFVCAVARKP